jgi:TatD DNase family protein
MKSIIETHAHIYDEAFDTDRVDMLDNAKKIGISEIWMPNCDSSTLASMMQLAGDYPGYCLPMVGLHPCYVNENFEAELLIVENELNNQKPLAIGEIGLDLFWDKTFFEQQKEVFLFQSQLAIKHNLWIDIHSRNAFCETVELIEKIANRRLKGIFHCFTGTLEEAKKAIELGYLLGIGGVATFKNGAIDKWLPEIDIKNLVLETDAPYLAPVPYRGKRNEPKYLELIGQKLADIYGISVEEVYLQTTQNAINLKNQYL